MRRLSLIILTISIWCSSIYGVNTNYATDSFISKANRSTLEDSVAYLLHVCKSNLDLYPKKAFQQAALARAISDKIRMNEKSAIASSYMGEAKIITEEYYEARKHLLQAESYFKDKNTPQIGNIYFLIAKADLYLANYKESKSFFQKAIYFFENNENQQMAANSYQNLGILHHELNDIKNAKYYYRKALQINQALKNKSNIAALYQNLGLILYRDKDYTAALEYYEKSVETYYILGDTSNIATTFSNIGLIRLGQKRYVEAFSSFKQSEELFRHSRVKFGQMWALHNMGTAKLYLQQYTQAEKYYQQSMQLADSINTPEGILSNLDALSELHAQRGNYQDAYFYYVDYTQLRDSIHSQETRNKINELESLYQIESREKLLNESQLQLHQQKSQKFIITALLILLAAFTIFIFVAYLRKKSSVSAIHSSKMSLENVLSAKNKELENQINVRKIAEESDKLKSAFLANMSHELRTPMNAIIAFSNFLREPDLSIEKREEYLDHITGAGDSLLRLIDDIIDIAKLESKQLKISIGPVNISRMLREMQKVYAKIKAKNQYPANLVLTQDESRDYIVNTDVIRIKQIISNLIDNSFKYTKEGTIEFGVNTTNDGLLFYVRDTGIGIPEEKKASIFDRFQQVESGLNRKFGGTGLGLAICKNLTELLGGKIWFDSEVDQGSVFYVLIPNNNLRMVDKQEPALPASKGKVKTFDWNNKTILIAEDEELNYRVLSSCLKKTNINIIRADDGAKAVDICLNENIDLVLMDIQMPVMDGYEATQKIKTHKNVPVIAQTSFAMANEKELCLQAGCDDYLTKPLDLDQLLTRIDHHLG